MASSEGVPALSTHEDLERNKFELAESIKIVTKLMDLDGKKEAAMMMAINGGDLGASSDLNGHPHKGHLKDVLAELIRQRDMLARNVGPNNEHGAPTTTINGRSVGAGSTSGHGNPYIAHLEAEKAELRRERELGAGQFGPTNGHRAATTTSNGRDVRASSTAETPQIIVTAPQDGHGAVATTTNGRGLRAGSMFTPVPDDGRGLVINPFTRRYYRLVRLRRRITEADRNRMVPEDVLRLVNTANGDRPDIEASTALIAYTYKLLQDMDVEVKLAKKNKGKLLTTMSKVCTVIAMGFIIRGSLEWWSARWP